jgi:hypothetical protein
MQRRLCPAEQRFSAADEIYFTTQTTQDTSQNYERISELAD